MNVLPVEQRRDAKMKRDSEQHDNGPASVPDSFGVPTSPVAQIIGIVRKRRWALIACTTGALILGFIVTLLMTPIYTATATLEIQRESQNFTNVAGAEDNERSFADPEYYQTQYGLLQMRSLAERIASQLRLHDDAAFFTLFGDGRVDDWFANGRVIPNASTRPERIAAAASILKNNMAVNPQRLSRLVEISFDSPDASFSKRVIDAWSRNFIEMTLERRYETTSYARKFLESRLAQLRIRIDRSERQLVAYAAQQGIVNLPSETRSTGGGAQAERSLAADDLAALNRELAQATAERIQAQSRLSADGGFTDEALNNAGISQLRATRADLAGQYAKMLQTFEPGYPAAKDLKRQIDQIDRSIAGEDTRVRKTLQQSYDASQARERELTARVQELKNSVLDVRRRSIEYNVLQREVDTNQQLYDALLQRYKEIGIAGGVGVNNIAVVNPAVLPKTPSSPRLMLNMAISLLLGLGLGFAVALLMEQLRDSFDDPAEVGDVLGVPLLGTVPRTANADPREALQDPKDALTEAYLSLRASLGFSTNHGFPSTVAVTSSRPAEGKSLTSFALAHALAKADQPVLLIDADMRLPSAHHMFSVDNSKGLSNYLTGSDDLMTMVHPTSKPGLYLLPAGPIPPSAADLLTGDRFAQLLDELAGRFPHIIIDAPPVMGMADAPLITSRVEGAVFVVEAHSTTKGVARTAMYRLRASGTRMLGIVITKFDSRKAHVGYGYDYGYSYGYGQEERERS